MEKELTVEQFLTYLLTLGSRMEQIEKIVSEIEIPKEEPEAPIDIDEVASLVGKEKGTIYNLVSQGKFPVRKAGGKLYFFKSEVIQFIRDAKRKTCIRIKNS